MSAYSAVILAESSLVSYWKLDEPSGTSAADSKGANTGTYSGTYTQGVMGIGGDGGTAVNFATSGQVTVGNPSNLQLVAPFSLEAWINIPNTSDTDPVMVKYSGASGFAGYGIRLNATTSGRVDFWCGSAWDTGTVTLTANVWHHIVCTLSGTTGTIYVDGVQDKTGTVTVNLSTAANFVIGEDNLGQVTKAIIDEVAVYNTALSSGAVAAHYAAGIAARALFRQSSMDGLGCGGPFSSDPLTRL